MRDTPPGRHCPCVPILIFRPVWYTYHSFGLCTCLRLRAWKCASSVYATFPLLCRSESFSTVKTGVTFNGARHHSPLNSSNQSRTGFPTVLQVVDIASLNCAAGKFLNTIFWSIIASFAAGQTAAQTERVFTRNNNFGMLSAVPCCRPNSPETLPQCLSHSRAAYA